MLIISFKVNGLVVMCRIVERSFAEWEKSLVQCSVVFHNMGCDLAA
jgi:hypothetical protein